MRGVRLHPGYKSEADFSFLPAFLLINISLSFAAGVILVQAPGHARHGRRTPPGRGKDQYNERLGSLTRSLRWSPSCEKSFAAVIERRKSQPRFLAALQATCRRSLSVGRGEGDQLRPTTRAPLQ